jgi:hypothetical protein
VVVAVERATVGGAGLLLLFVVATALLCTGATGENTPPSVQLLTPHEGDSLALSVTVSGKATDVEGFNISSYVEARWNDWEWFDLPITPADGGLSIVFGEMVNLDFHAPGDHTLHVRACDGELFSETVSVEVTVRDLPDLVILPSDITMDPRDVREGERTAVSVVVRNQGGEDVPDVEVTLMSDGVELDSLILDAVLAGSEAFASFEVGPEEGNVTFRASAYSLQPVDERSEANNEAQRSFTVGPPVAEGDDWDRGMLVTGMAVLAVAVVLVALYAYAVVTSRKD